MVCVARTAAMGRRPPVTADRFRPKGDGECASQSYEGCLPRGTHNLSLTLTLVCPDFASPQLIIVPTKSRPSFVEFISRPLISGIIAHQAESRFRVEFATQPIAQIM